MKRALRAAEQYVKDMELQKGTHEYVNCKRDFERGFLTACSWIDTGIMPDYDGDYLCNIIRHNECGTFSEFQRVVNCKFNQWVIIDQREWVTHWQQLPESPNNSLKIIQSSNL